MIPDFSEFVRQVWQYKPVIIIFAMIGFVIFVLLVIDTHRHRKKRKERHRVRRLH